MSKTIGADVPKSAHRAFDEIAWANRMDKSTLVRRAVDHYLRTNPEGIVIPTDDLDTWKAAMAEYRE